MRREAPATGVSGGVLLISPFKMLVVEDNAADVYLLEEALRVHNLAAEMVVLTDGEKAIRWIESHDAPGGEELPAVILLDLNLPKRHGAEVLERIRSSRSFRDVPVVLFTSSNSARDRSLVDTYGHTWYFRKSADIDEFMSIGQVLGQVIAS